MLLLLLLYKPNQSLGEKSREENCTKTVQRGEKKSGKLRRKLYIKQQQFLRGSFTFVSHSLWMKQNLSSKNQQQIVTKHCAIAIISSASLIQKSKKKVFRNLDMSQQLAARQNNDRNGDHRFQKFQQELLENAVDVRIEPEQHQQNHLVVVVVAKKRRLRRRPLHIQ